MRLRHVQSDTPTRFVIAAVDHANAPDNAAAATFVFPVSAGSNTFEMQMSKNPGAPQRTRERTGFTREGVLRRAQFRYMPFGSTGAGSRGDDAPAPAGGLVSPAAPARILSAGGQIGEQASEARVPVQTSEPVRGRLHDPAPSAMALCSAGEATASSSAERGRGVVGLRGATKGRAWGGPVVGARPPREEGTV
jgi:hypothetical protein